MTLSQSDLDALLDSAINGGPSPIKPSVEAKEQPATAVSNNETQIISDSDHQDDDLLELTKNETRARGGEMSAQAIGRMLGLATVGELKLVEQKCDLVISRINVLGLKVDKCLGALGRIPTGNDMERIDLQLSTIKSMVREVEDLIIRFQQQKAGEAPVNSTTPHPPTKLEK